MEKATASGGFGEIQGELVLRSLPQAFACFMFGLSAGLPPV
jgi:hypothetical protein